MNSDQREDAPCQAYDGPEPSQPSVQALLDEFGRRQNSYFVRDALPPQVEIKNFWLAVCASAGPLDLDDVGLSVFSQNNEDGILLYLFSRIGFATRTSIEIGCNIDNTTLGIPEGNSVNLLVNFAFHGMIIDMEAEHIDGLRHFFSTCLTTRHFHQSREVGGGRHSPVLVQAEVTPENVDELMTSAGFVGEVDLLSVDIDGNDLHVLRALSAVSPRVLVVEVNSRLPFEEPVWAGPVPDWGLDPETTAFRQSSGASLVEMCRVVEERGYVFVGLNNILINAFFVRDDVFEGSGLRRMSVADFRDHRLRPPESLRE